MLWILDFTWGVESTALDGGDDPPNAEIIGGMG